MKPEYQRCPVCDGHGCLPYPPGVAVGMPFYSSSCGPWTCPTCNGARIILRPIEPTIHGHGHGAGTGCEACASIRSDPQGLRLNIPAHTCKPAKGEL